MDYYEIVGVDRMASREAIDRTLRNQLRHWQQRTASADLDRRQEAERRVRQLREARATLLNDERRGRYDRQLGERGPRDAPPAQPTRPDRGRFDTLPESVPPDAWIEEVPAEGTYEPPESHLGNPYAV